MDERNMYDFEKLDDAKLSLDKKFSNLLFLKSQMEKYSLEKRDLMTGDNGTTLFEEKIKEYERRKYGANPYERAELENMLEEFEAKLEENKYLIKETQINLNYTSNKVLELAKEIFGDSTNIIIRLLDTNMLHGESTEDKLDSIEIHYFERAIGRMKRICKLYPEEEEKLNAIEAKKMSRKCLDELRKYFEIQRETLEIVCSPIIEVVPESERNLRSLREQNDLRSE